MSLRDSISTHLSELERETIKKYKQLTEFTREALAVGCCSAYILSGISEKQEISFHRSVPHFLVFQLAMSTILFMGNKDVCWASLLFY